MKSMLQVISLAFLSLTGAAGNRACAAEPPSPPELLKEYKSLGLPLPPENAKLIRYRASGTVTINGVEQPPRHELAFELKPATGDSGPLILLGTEEQQERPRFRSKEMNPDVEAAKAIAMYPEDSLALAIQCQARGWQELAKGLLELSRKTTKEHHERPLLARHDRRRPDPELPLDKQLLYIAWDYWVRQITHPTRDRAPVANRLKELMQREPKLDTRPARALLDSLELALVPSKAKPGSVEALIDALVDYNGDVHPFGGQHPGRTYWQIAELGFDAVPALIEHLNDARLTRTKSLGFNNFSDWHMRVGDFVGTLLESLATEELMRGADGVDVGGGWLRRIQGYAVTNAAAKAWWEKARKIPEETYLLERVFMRPEQAEGRVNYHMLRVIAAKYPKHVPVLYKQILEKYPKLETDDLAETLVRCSLPRKDKLDVLLLAAKHERYEQQQPAFRAIKELDQKQFDSLLIATIEGFKVEPWKQYWTCPAAHLAQFAVDCDDRRVWTALEKVAKRSPVGLRMELVGLFAKPCMSRHRAERLRYLASFLGDEAVRDAAVDIRLDGPNAGEFYDRIEVRNFVATQVAALLEIEVREKNRTPAEWAEIRTKVRQALKREFDKPK